MGLPLCTIYGAISKCDRQWHILVEYQRPCMHACMHVCTRTAGPGQAAARFVWDGLINLRPPSLPALLPPSPSRTRAGKAELQPPSPAAALGLGEELLRLRDEVACAPTYGMNAKALVLRAAAMAAQAEGTKQQLGGDRGAHRTAPTTTTLACMLWAGPCAREWARA